jgi:hypothetical protein
MKKPRRPTRLPHWQEWSIYLSFGALLATGVVWLLLDWFVRVNGEFGPEHHPAEHWMLVAHGAAAYAFLVIVGAALPVHVVLGWNIGRNLKTGMTFLGASLILGVSALGLYYLGGDAARTQASLIHWIIGLAAAPVLLIHALRGRSGLSATRPRAKSPPRPDRRRPVG